MGASEKKYKEIPNYKQRRALERCFMGGVAQVCCRRDYQIGRLYTQ